MKGSIAPNRPGHHGTVVARTVGTVAISCNVIDGTMGGHTGQSEPRNPNEPCWPPGELI